MKIVNYISNIAIPAVILIILLYGLFERKNVFDIFLSVNNFLYLEIALFESILLHPTSKKHDTNSKKNFLIILPPSH